jgi:aryl-alcohol dehydrogenase-like predicted oxidoreductase
MMKQRKLGTNGPEVSAIGFGCYGLSGAYGTQTDEESIRTIQHAIDLGITLLNTSDTYGAGHNESLIGQAIKGRRDRVFVCTKFGNPGRDANNKPIGTCGRPEYLPIACERSMKRLGVEMIDLYELHRVDRAVPIEDTVGAMARLVEAGKVRTIGLSEASARTLRRAHAVHPIAALESEYSLWSREPELEVLPACRELGVSFMAYSPLGRGFLAGAIKERASFGANDPRSSMPRFQGDNLAANLRRLQLLEGVAAEKRCTVAQLALAWVLARGEDVIPIPGTRRVEHLQENLAALSIALDEQDMARIDDIMPRGAAAGERYAADYMQSLDL